MLDPAAYRTFNLIIADERDCFWLRHAGGARIELHPLKEGLSMIAAGDSTISGPAGWNWRCRRFAHGPCPTRIATIGLLGNRCSAAPGRRPASRRPAAMRFRTDGYGTVSSALIALPALGDRSAGRSSALPAWLPDTGAVARSFSTLTGERR